METNTENHYLNCPDNDEKQPGIDEENQKPDQEDIQKENQKPTNEDIQKPIDAKHDSLKEPVSTVPKPEVTEMGSNPIAVEVSTGLGCCACMTGFCCCCSSFGECMKNWCDCCTTCFGGCFDCCGKCVDGTCSFGSKSCECCKECSVSWWDCTGRNCTLCLYCCGRESWYLSKKTSNVCAHTCKCCPGIFGDFFGCSFENCKKQCECFSICIGLFGDCFKSSCGKSYDCAQISCKDCCPTCCSCGEPIPNPDKDE